MSTRRSAGHTLALLGRLWARGFAHPGSAMRALPQDSPGRVGLAAALGRFTVQDLVQTLPLAMLGRHPFMPATVPVRPENHYRAQLLFLPAFGMAEWLLMSGAVGLVLRMAGNRVDLGRIMDVIGLGMLVPMPLLWGADAVLITADRFRMPQLGFVNVPVQLWETVLFGVGLRVALDVPGRHAATAAVAASAVYVLGSSRFVR